MSARIFWAADAFRFCTRHWFVALRGRSVCRNCGRSQSHGGRVVRFRKAA